MSKKLTHLMAEIYHMEPTTWYTVYCRCAGRSVSTDRDRCLHTEIDPENLYKGMMPFPQQWDSESVFLCEWNKMRVYRTLLAEGWTQRRHYHKADEEYCSDEEYCWVWISPLCKENTPTTEE